MYLYIDVEKEEQGANANTPWLAASFMRKEEALAWYAGMKPDVQKFLVLQERPDLTYPFYIIWDFKNPNVEERVKYVTEEQADAFMRGIKRDLAWEKKVEDSGEDDQYFYLGIIKWEGESYKMGLAMGRQHRFDYGHFDHDHVTGWRMKYYQREGFRRMYWDEERLASLKKMKYVQRKLRRLIQLDKRGIKQNQKVMERLARKMERHMLAVDDWSRAKRRHEEWVRNQRPWRPPASWQV